MNSPTPASHPLVRTPPHVFLLLMAALLASTVLLSSCASVKRMTGSLLGIVTESVPEEMRGRGLKNLVQDRRTTSQIKSELIAAGSTHFSAVEVHIYGDVALLVGQVRNAQRRDRAAEIAGRASQVAVVINELEIAPPRYSDRVHNNLLVGKVKSALANRADINVDRVKVIGADRKIYLLGNLSAAQRHLVEQLASRVKGVRKVVNGITPF